MTTPDVWAHKDNEFIAWYPLRLTPEAAATVWQPRPAGYYVHIPYCTAICDYCGFAVERLKGADTGRYVEALCTEIKRYADNGRLSRYEFACGHFGGGTPSALPADQLLAVKQLLDKELRFTADAEITVEVNPISCTADKAAAYAANGINRISIGVQSFDESTLRTIGRPHRTSDVDQVLRVVQDAGFRNYSLDLIYGVPGQTVKSLRQDLIRAAQTGATHLSCFRLEVIPFTALKLRSAAGMLPDPLSEQQLNEMDDVVSQVLTGLGYLEYGAFNFAKPGFESVHNRIAFAAPQGEYFGFGNSSYSYVDGHIYCNHAEVHRYVADVRAGRDPIGFAQRATPLEEMSRYFVLGVKFRRVPRSGFVGRFGITPEEVFGDVLDDLGDRGMLRLEGDDYVLTDAGRRYVNNVCKSFYVGENRGSRQYLQFVPTLTVDQIAGYARRAAREDHLVAKGGAQ